MNPFIRMVENRWSAGARVCIGLDSEYEKLPPYVTHNRIVPVLRLVTRVSEPWAQLMFNREIVRETRGIALAYKINIAFYRGPGGLRALIETVEFIHEFAPGVPVILDAKRADIGNTNHGYVAEAFDIVKADAVTLHNYLGQEALKPFLERADKGIIVLCKTSNAGGGEFQDLEMRVPEDGIRPLYLQVAHAVANRWNTNGNCALVVGATYPEQLRQVRAAVGDMHLLIPGIGAQGGDLEQSIVNGVNSKKSGIIINSSSGIIFASKKADFAEAAYRKTQELTHDIDHVLDTIV